MYSIEVRILALNVYKKLKSLRKVSKLLDIGKSTIHRWITKIQQKQRKKKQYSFVSSIIQFIEQNPYCELNDIKQKFNLKIGIVQLHRILKQNNITRKRTFDRQINNEKIQQKTQIFLEEIKNIDMNKTLFIDETGINKNIKPEYGYSKKGTRIILKQGYNQYNRKQTKFNIIILINTQKVLNYYITRDNICSKNYQEFIENTDLKQYKNIVLDNVSYHKNQKFYDYCKKRGINLIFTPPYSPQYNPIENIIGIFKRKIKKQFQDLNNFKQKIEQVLQSLNFNISFYYVKNKN